MAEPFPLYDPDVLPNIQVFDFKPLQPYKPFAIPRSTASSGSTRVATTPSSSAATPASNNLYCKECKKKFNNDATMQNHLKSAKHLAAVKKAGGSKKVVPQSKTNNQEGFINPETTESLKRLENISKLEAKEAASAYLAVSKEFYEQKRPLYITKALSGLVSLNLVDTDHHWLALLVLARLYCIYDNQMETAYDIYFDILEQKYKIKKDEVFRLAKCCGRISAMGMMEDCGRMMQEKTLVPGLSSLLVESAGAFAQTNTVVKGLDGTKMAEKVAIVLYSLASMGFDDQQKPFKLYPMISQIYDSIGLPHCSLDIQVLHVDHLMKSSPTTDTTAMLLLLSILLRCVENDDYSRVDSIDQHISIDGFIYPELSLLSKIARARRNLDYHSLAYDLKLELDHLDLRAMNGDAKLLLMSLDDNTRLEYLQRLRQCCCIMS